MTPGHKWKKEKGTFPVVYQSSSKSSVHDFAAGAGVGTLGPKICKRSEVMGTMERGGCGERCRPDDARYDSFAWKMIHM